MIKETRKIPIREQKNTKIVAKAINIIRNLNASCSRRAVATSVLLKGPYKSPDQD